MMDNTCNSGISTASTGCKPVEPDSQITVETEHTSQPDMYQIYDQLEQMKQRVLQLRRHLVQDLPLPEEYVKSLREVELHGSKNEHLKQVQLQTQIISNQLVKLTWHLTREEKQVNHLECNLQLESQERQKLDTRWKALDKWPQTQKDRAARCIENKTDLSMTLCHPQDYAKPLEVLYRKFAFDSGLASILKCYRNDRTILLDRLKRLRLVMRNSSNLVLHHTSELMRLAQLHCKGVSFQDAPMSYSAYSSESTHLSEYDESGVEEASELTC